MARGILLRRDESRAPISEIPPTFPSKVRSRWSPRGDAVAEFHRHRTRRAADAHGEIDDHRLLSIELPEAELVVEIEDDEERVGVRGTCPRFPTGRHVGQWKAPTCRSSPDRPSRLKYPSSRLCVPWGPLRLCGSPFAVEVFPGALVAFEAGVFVEFSGLAVLEIFGAELDFSDLVCGSALGGSEDG